MGFVGAGTAEESRLISIESKIDILLTSNSAGGISFSLIDIQPSFSLNPASGWANMPSALANISDSNISTSTNIFEVGGASNVFGEIVIIPGIDIPQYTRIQASLAFSSNNSGRPLLELAAANLSSGTYLNIWSYFPRISMNTSEVAANIDVIVPYAWASLKFTIWDIGQFGCRCRINDLKVWQVF